MAVRVSCTAMKEIAKRQDVISKFRQFDANGDGIIDKAELGVALKAIDKSWSDSRIDRLFRVLDTNSDGRVDYDEFISWVFATPGIRTKDLETFRAAVLSAPAKKVRFRGPSPGRGAACGQPVQSQGCAHASVAEPPVAACSSEASPEAPPCPETSNDAPGLIDFREHENADGAAAQVGAPSASAEESDPILELPQTVVNWRVVNVAGAEIGTVDSVDLIETTGSGLKQIIADAFGFPVVNMKLVLTTGEEITGAALCRQLSICNACNACADDHLVVCCVPTGARPIGRKERDNPASRYFGGKAGLILEMRMEEAARKRTSLVKTLRNPDEELRADAEKLIKASFAKHLEPLIDVAIDASYHNDPEQAVDDHANASGFSYMDPESQAIADLSACRLWMNVLDAEAREDLHFHDVILRDLAAYGYGRLVGAVLWRLLDGWEGSPGTETEPAVPAGPVLEVLFLATSPMLRETGEAKRLVKELETTASSLGCAAIAVAAVPWQGVRFWTKSCSYKVLVPLREDADANEPDSSVLGEPVNFLGSFLMERMLLFTDTPLVAKVLG